MELMLSFLPGLYLAALVFQIWWLIKAVKKSDKKLWARDFKFTAFMCLFSYVMVFMFGGISDAPSTDADLAALNSLAPFVFSFVAGIVFLAMWAVILLVGLSKFKKK